MVEDDDFVYALSLQDQFDRELNLEKSKQDLIVPSTRGSKLPLTSVVDESWELIDPIPDIRQLFLQFNDAYFSGLLGSVEVRWSPRMTLCAGLCCYEGRGGLCSIRLSQPLLKLRPRKDLVQTLLHEMIHALLFVTHNNKDHDAHGPEFLKHMQRINLESGANITVYHNFHDEVNVYRQHWWQCDGPCRKRPPYYGIVRRAMNRAPSPRDPWWADHQRTCGGTYTKIKEPENYGARKTAKSKQGKNETEKGFKGKEQVFNGAESGTLPHFLKRKSRENQKDNGNSFGSNKETVKKRKKNLDGDSVESEPVIDDGVVKGKKADQEVLSRSAADVIPFSGPGRVLGFGSTPNVGKEPLHLPAKMNRPHNGETSGSKTYPVVVIKTPSPSSKLKPKALSTLTIVDAFKRIKDKSEAGGKERTGFSSSLLGSDREPIELLEESACSAVHSITNSQSGLQARESVLCPVCQALVKTSAINEHLDTCL